MARRRGARGAFLPRRRRRFHTRGARGRRQSHRLRPRDLAAPDGARDVRRTIVARDEHRRGPSLSPRRPAMRRALAALATIVVFTGGALALAQSDIFDPGAIAVHEREQLIDAKPPSAAAMARSALLEKQAEAARSEAEIGRAAGRDRGRKYGEIA